MKEGEFYQQGDVCVIKIAKIKGKKLNHLTVATGETTGHTHTITEGDAELYEDNGVLYLRVKSESATLTHQQHNPITIEKGNYEVSTVKEYDHLNEEIRNVQD